jgi:urease gamma subunit
MEVKMKKITALFITVLFVMTFWAAAVYAEGTDSTPTDSTTAVTTAATTAATTVATTAKTTAATTVATTAETTAATTATTAAPGSETITSTEVTITPDNIFYSLKILVENIQVALTFPAGEKAELLVTLADKRLAEAELMTEANKLELVQSVMQAYADTMEKAAENLQTAAQNGSDVTPVFDDIRIVELTADKLVIKATGILPAESADALKALVTEQVKSTLAAQAFAIAKSDFEEASDAVEAAREELKKAEESGDAAAIAAAKAAFEPWSNTPCAKRVEVLYKFRELLIEHHYYVEKATWK